MKRLLLLYDVEGWCWHYQALDLQAFAPEDYSVTVMRGDAPDDVEAEFDAVLSFSWPECRRFTGRSGFVLAHHGATFSPEDESYLAKSATSRIRNSKEFERVVAQHAYVIAVNKPLYEFAATHHANGYYTNVYYLPAGVNTRVYQPRQTLGWYSRKLRVGWCGQRSAKENTKGQHAILMPLMARLGGQVEFVVNDRTHQTALSRDEMADWYNSIDVFLCTASTEGTPMPPLEAMACGRPVISTPVGDMSNVINHEQNGYLVPSYASLDGSDAGATVEAIRSVLLNLSDNLALCRQWGTEASRTIVAIRSWDTWAGEWLAAIAGDI